MLTVWSLSSNSVQYVKNPKSWSTSRTLHNRDGCYSFIVERRECRDWINIFTGDWQLVRQVELDTEDCAGAEWSSSSDMIVVWDSCLYYRVQVRGKYIVLSKQYLLTAINSKNNNFSTFSFLYQNF